MLRVLCVLLSMAVSSVVVCRTAEATSCGCMCMNVDELRERYEVSKAVALEAKSQYLTAKFSYFLDLLLLTPIPDWETAYWAIVTDPLRSDDDKLMADILWISCSQYEEYELQQAAALSWEAAANQAMAEAATSSYAEGTSLHEGAAADYTLAKTFLAGANGSAGAHSNLNDLYFAAAAMCAL